jgi:hypothetical protein
MVKKLLKMRYKSKSKKLKNKSKSKTRKHVVGGGPSDNSSKQPKEIILKDLKKILDHQFVLNQVQLYEREGTAYFDIPNEYIDNFNNNTLANFIYDYMAVYGYNYAPIHSSGHSLDPLDTLNNYAKPFKRTDDLNGFFIFCQKDYKFLQGEYKKQYNIAHFPEQQFRSGILTIFDNFNSIAIKDLH